MKLTLRNFIFWSPRILWIAFAVFVSLFALDVFEPGIPFWSALGGFLIHLIPTYILIIVLIFSWKWEWIGAVSAIVLAILYIFPFSHADLHWSEFVFIALPLLVMGVLFLLGWILKREEKKRPS